MLIQFWQHKTSQIYWLSLAGYHRGPACKSTWKATMDQVISFISLSIHC